MITGDSTDWDDFFQQTLIPAAFSLILMTWQSLPKINSKDLEDKISDRLFNELKNAKQRYDFPFLVRREDLEFDLDEAIQTGRKDIVFFPSLLYEDIYLCLEAKRLNVGTHSLADEYVKEGMQRFVDRKYARRVKHGMMIGYVLDGNISRAVRNIQKNIKKHCIELRMGTVHTFVDSIIRPADPHCKETHHYREGETKVFCIHHLFVT